MNKTLSGIQWIGAAPAVELGVTTYSSSTSAHCSTVALQLEC